MKKTLILSGILVQFVIGIVNAQERPDKDRIINKYNNETEIKAVGSVTLKDGFFIPADPTRRVRIFTEANFQDFVNINLSPSQNRNYILSRTFKAPGVRDKNIDSIRKVNEVNQVVQYFDGLGRPLQSVSVQGSPTFRDVVEQNVYDAYGRELKKYLPYVSALAASNGSFKMDAAAEQHAFYTNPGSGVVAIPDAAFSETRFEASPLNRVFEQGSPGADWQLATGHTQKTEYGTNASGMVKLWNLTADGAESTSFYESGQLYKTISRDENTPTGQKKGSIEEYKNIEGQVILKRLWETESISLNTYYIYDDWGSLRYVIPPAVTQNSFAENDVVFDQYIYGYQYDSRNRVIEKKIPGKGWESMVYNKLDQVVYTQDRVQKSKGDWMFSKYDALNRVVMAGLVNDRSDRLALQATLDLHAAKNLPLWEDRDNANETGYTNNALPNASISLYYTINYYDNYDFKGMQSVLPSQSSEISTRTKGLLTGIRVYQTDGIKSLWTLNYYDKEGQLRESISQNHLDGTDRVINDYSFSKELTATMRTHIANGVTTTIANRYEYDHMGRKIVTYQSINGTEDSKIVLSKQDYNELGQLQKKSLHSTDNGLSFLQHTEYEYNARGWLKKSISNQFGMELQYQDGVTPQFNGNISGQIWRMDSNPTNSFTYGYDALNRLLNASSISAGMNEALTYDVMGNISTLNRDGLGLSEYSYTGNRLNKVSTGPLATGLYSYDVNGNVIIDGRNNVSIDYNYLNLPNAVKKSGLNLSYVYNSQGQKLQKINDGAVRNYINGIEYDGNKIDIIHTEEGVARNNNGVFSYEYNLSDHLGNVRYTFRRNRDLGTLERLQSDDYYAFGLRKSSGSPVSLNNKYLYNGKEIQDELGGQYDYGARFYDPVIGRWNAVDPMAEDFDDASPYNYGLNNPIKFIDPDGMAPIDPTKKQVRQALGTTAGGIIGGAFAAGGTVALAGTGTVIGAPVGWVVGGGIIVGGLLGGGAVYVWDKLHESDDNTSSIVMSSAKTTEKATEKPSSVKDAESKSVKEGLPTPLKGRGTVPPSQRDPKRAYTKKEKEEMLKKQDGNCASCGEKKTVDEVAGHHKKRHADGGKTTAENGAAVCKDCHVKIHK